MVSEASSILRAYMHTHMRARASAQTWTCMRTLHLVPSVPHMDIALGAVGAAHGHGHGRGHRHGHGHGEVRTLHSVHSALQVLAGVAQRRTKK